MGSTTNGTPTSVTSQGTLQLPQEIIDLFIDNLYQNLETKETRKALAPCTLVSRSFSASARRRLWSTLVISGRVSSLQVRSHRFGSNESELELALYQRLLSLRLLLESQSDFRLFIRRVNIEVGPVIYGDPELTGLRSVVDGLRSRAKNMDTLWITRSPRAKPVSWPVNKPSITQPLVTLLSSVEFRCLRIEGVRDLPTDLLTICSSIQSFQLVSTTFKQKSMSQNSPNTVQLEHLLVQNCLEDAYREICRSKISLSRIRKFQACISSWQEASIVQKLIKGARFSLISLELTVRVERIKAAHASSASSTIAGGHNIDLGWFANLVNFRLQIQRVNHIYFPSLEDKFSLLIPITRPTRLESIEIIIIHRDLSSVFEALRLYQTDEAAWTLFDPSILRNKHPHLRRLFIKLDLGFGSSSQISSSEKRDIEHSLHKLLQSICFPSTSTPISNSTHASLDLNVVVL